LGGDLRVHRNSFRPVAADPTWRAWQAGTIPRLAEAIYDDRAFDRLPILADALEEAGCTDSAVSAEAGACGVGIVQLA
jgi:hypothetical protein